MTHFSVNNFVLDRSLCSPPTANCTWKKRTEMYRRPAASKDCTWNPAHGFRFINTTSVTPRPEVASGKAPVEPHEILSYETRTPFSEEEGEPRQKEKFRIHLAEGDELGPRTKLKHYASLDPEDSSVKRSAPPSDTGKQEQDRAIAELASEGNRPVSHTLKFGDAQIQEILQRARLVCTKSDRIARTLRDPIRGLSESLTVDELRQDEDLAKNAQESSGIVNQLISLTRKAEDDIARLQTQDNEDNGQNDAVYDDGSKALAITQQDPHIRSSADSMPSNIGKAGDIESLAGQLRRQLHINVPETPPFAEIAEDPIPLSYQINSAKFEEAQASRSQNSPDHIDSCWHYSLYEGPEGQEVPVHYCHNRAQSEQVASLFRGERILGFDVEWVPPRWKGQHLSSKQNVALIQLASQSRIALFHIALHAGTTAEELVSPTLKEILEDRDIVKLGGNIKSDCTRVRTHLAIDTTPMFELSYLYKLITYAPTAPALVNRSAVKLTTMCEAILGLPMYKESDTRTENWDRHLPIEKIGYAASDAYVAVHLFDAMNRRRLDMHPVVPDLPPFAGGNEPIQIPGPFWRASASRERRASARYPTQSTSNNEEDLSSPAASHILSDSSLDPLATNESEALAAASEWSKMYLASRNTPGTSSRKLSILRRASPSQLLAYALWSQHDFKVERIARLMRAPPREPLACGTVAAYILEGWTDVSAREGYGSRLEDEGDNEDDEDGGLPLGDQPEEEAGYEESSEYSSSSGSSESDSEQDANEKEDPSLNPTDPYHLGPLPTNPQSSDLNTKTLTTAPTPSYQDAASVAPQRPAHRSEERAAARSANRAWDGLDPFEQAVYLDRERLKQVVRYLRGGWVEKRWKRLFDALDKADAQFEREREKRGGCEEE
ncbi:MAG: hypothetical protein M1831_002488 [Alyxoria varia]|nr:MAG: hypothetical protein M1831_002488 [Alyxoria varia]